MKQKVVVIGHGYTSRLGIIRSLGLLGCDITVIAMVAYNWFSRIIRFDGGKPVDCHSKYVNRVLFCPAQDGNALIDLLLNRCVYPQQKVVLIPDSDFSASIVDKHQERLKEYFLFPHIHHKPGAVEYWMHKTVQKELAKKLGLNVTEGKVVLVKNHTYDFPSDIHYPCFTKPLVTINGGKQFNRCDSESDLRKVLDRIAQYNDMEVLIEDFKIIDSEFAVVGFSDGDNVIIPGVIEFIVNSKSHFGIAREGKIMPTTGFEPLLEQFKTFVRSVGFCGLFDIDFYESNGKQFFGELNLRFGGSGYAYTAMGVNLPAMLLRTLLGDNFEGMKQTVTETATYVNERMCVDDWSFYHISENEMNDIIKGADIRFVMDEKDPGPQKKLQNYIKQQRIKRVLRKWIKK